MSNRLSYLVIGAASFIGALVACAGLACARMVSVEARGTLAEFAAAEKQASAQYRLDRAGCQSIDPASRANCIASAHAAELRALALARRQVELGGHARMAAAEEN